MVVRSSSVYIFVFFFLDDEKEKRGPPLSSFSIAVTRDVSPIPREDGVLHERQGDVLRAPPSSRRL